MEENLDFENEIDNENDSDINTESDPQDGSDSVTNEDILQAINELKGDTEDENGEDDIEGDSLLDIQNPTESSDEDAEVVDYTEVLNSIYSKLDSMSDNTHMTYETLSDYVEYQSQGILDKPLNDYTVGESIGLVIVTVCIGRLFFEIFERIWMKWK